MRTAAGPIDALFVNRHGLLTIVECKLWRNPQARREVVGQILDYAKELARWDYEDLQREVSTARKQPGNALFRLVADRHPEVEETAFVDRVTRGLRTGRFLLLLAGDGIRERTETIVQYLQEHTGLRFTLGLVEMAGYALPDGRMLVQPRVLARTTMIERVVVRVEEANGRGEAASEPSEPAAPAITPKQAASVLADPTAQAADVAFWRRFTEALRLDDPSQPLPVREGFGRVRFDLGAPGRGAWVTAYRSRDGILGVFARFRSETWRSLAEGLDADIEPISAEISSQLDDPLVRREETTGNGMQALRYSMDHPSPMPWTPEVEAEQIAWLTRTSNVFVNVFRPRVKRLLDAP